MPLLSSLEEKVRGVFSILLYSLSTQRFDGPGKVTTEESTLCPARALLYFRFSLS